MEKSLLELAYKFLEKKDSPVAFNDIWAFVKEEANISEEEAKKAASRFFTNLLLDGRFVTAGDNVWDLRSRQKFDDIMKDIKDMGDVYSDIDQADDDNEEKKEEDEYNKMYEEDNVDEEDSGVESDESVE